MKLVPFDVVIPDAEQDHQLLEKLERERPGILRWAVDGCLAWYRHGLGTPDEVRQATAAYRGEMDPLGDFFGDRCLLDPAAHVTAADLYSNYTDWAKHAGETPLSQKALAGHLIDRGCIAGKKKGERAWTGLRLRGLLDVDAESVHGTDRDALSRNLPGKDVTQGSSGNARPDPSTGGDESTSDMFPPERTT
jgi:putative DNA primase/helicase